MYYCVNLCEAYSKIVFVVPYLHLKKGILKSEKFVGKGNKEARDRFASRYGRAH